MPSSASSQLHLVHGRLKQPMGQFAFSAAKAFVHDRLAIEVVPTVAVWRKVRRFMTCNSFPLRLRRGGADSLSHAAKAIDVVPETDIRIAGTLVVAIAGATVLGAEP